MNKPVRIKVLRQADPDLRKLARALLLLVEKQRSEQAKTQSDRKAS